MYRTLKVNDRDYQYTVGRTHTHIKGVGTFANSQVGHRVDTSCECCGEPMSHLYPDEDNTKVAVTPADVRKIILQAVA